MRSRTKAIARVVKTHGRLGEVVAVPARGLPQLLHAGMGVALVPPQLKASRWHKVVSVQQDDREGALVRLSDVGSVGEAQALVGKTILALEADLPEDFALLDVEGLIGRRVVDDAAGLSATISEVMRGPANDVWVLSGEKGELLLPVIPGVVDDVQPEGPIHIHVPAGLDWE